MKREELRRISYATYFFCATAAFMTLFLLIARTMEGVYNPSHPLDFGTGFSMGVDMVGIIVACCFAHSINLAKNINKKQSFYFSQFIASEILSLFADFITWACDGLNTPRAIIWNTIGNSASYIFNIVAVRLFIRCFTESFPHHPKLVNIYMRVLDVYSVALIILQLVNVGTGVLFTFENGTYVAGPAVFVTDIAYILFNLTIVFFLVYWRKTNFIERIVMITMGSVPILAVIIGIINPTIYLVPVAQICVFTVLFTHKHTFTELDILKAEEENEKSRNMLMISQIRPHFIYNTLSSITYLCKTNPDEAAALSERFAKYLRANVDSLEEQHNILITKEIENVVNFLEIEKVRFGERIQYMVDMQSTDFTIPMLSVQPLVGNAVKHGIGKKRQGGHILISTYEDENNYYVKVEDNGVGFDVKEKPSEDRTHTGISNVASRLKTELDGELLIESQVGVGTTSTIIIPKKEHKE